MASTKASLLDQFDEDQDFGLQEDWEDLEGDRFLQSREDGEGFGPPDIMIEGPSSDDDEEERRGGPPSDDDRFGGDDEDDFGRGGRRGNRNRRGGRGGRGGRRGGRGGKGRGWGKKRGGKGWGGKGRWGKGRKGGKGMKKQPFDIEKFLQGVDKKSEWAEKKLDRKCDRQLKWGIKLCDYVEDKETCEKWGPAKQIKCKANGKARIANRESVGKCMAEYKHLVASFVQDDIEARPGMDMDAVGDCFSLSLAEAKKAFGAADLQYKKASEGLTELSEEEIIEAKKAMKADRKKQRQSKRKWGRRSNRGNGSWRRRNGNQNDWRRKPSRKGDWKPQNKREYFEDESTGSYDEENEEPRPKFFN